MSALSLLLLLVLGGVAAHISRDDDCRDGNLQWAYKKCRELRLRCDDYLERDGRLFQSVFASWMRHAPCNNGDKEEDELDCGKTTRPARELSNTGLSRVRLLLEIMIYLRPETLAKELLFKNERMIFKNFSQKNRHHMLMAAVLIERRGDNLSDVICGLQAAIRDAA